MEVDRSQTVRSLDELERLELVRRTRDERDRRVQILSIEKKGQTLLNTLTKGVKSHERDAAKPLTPTEQSQLLKLLRTLNGS